MIRFGLLYIAVLMSLGGFTGQSAPLQSAPPAFTMAISTEQETVKPGAKVTVEIRLTNTSQKVLLFNRWAGGSDDEFRIDVRDSKGDLAPFTKGYVLGKTGSIHTYPVDRGETIKERIDITKQYDLSAPGKYTIQAHRLDRISNIDVKSSNTIAITVAD